MTSVKESVQETSEKWEAGCKQAHKCWRLLLQNEMSQATTALWFLEKNGVKRLSKKVAEQSTKRIAGGKLFALLICSSTTTRNGQFATVHADRRSWVTITDIDDPQRGNPCGAYSIDFYCSIGHAISCQWKYIKKERNQRNSNLNLGRRRRQFGSWKLPFRREVTPGSTNLSIHQRLVGKTLIWQQAWETWTIQGSCSTSTRWSLKLLIRKSPKESWRLYQAD